MVGITVLLLLAAASSFASCEQTGKMEIAFHCSIPNAQFTVQLWEEDKFSPDDMLSEKREYRFRRPHQKVEHVSFNVKLDGDETFSSAYKFYVIVNHNCEKRGKKVLMAKVYLEPPCPVGSPHCNYNSNVTLDNLKSDGKRIMLIDS